MYYNNRSNSYVKDSKLFIKPGLTSDQYGEAFLTSGVLNLHGGAPADQWVYSVSVAVLCARMDAPGFIKYTIKACQSCAFILLYAQWPSIHR